MSKDIPAFPSSNDIEIADVRTGGHSGMTLRDYFAGQALEGCLFREDCRKVWPVSEIASFAYRCADAMLAVREGREK